MSITTLATARAYLGVSSTAQDTVIQLLIDGVESWVETQFGIGLSSSEREELLDGGGLYLWPTFRPVTDVLAVVDTWDGGTEYDAILLSRSRIQRADEDGLAVAEAWPQGVKRFRVEYVAGHEDLPGAIQLAILQLVARSYNARGGENAQSAAGASVSFAALMDSDIALMLRPFTERRRVLA